MQQPHEVNLKLYIRKKDTTPTTNSGCFLVPYDAVHKSIGQLKNVSMHEHSCVKYIDMHMAQQIITDWSIRRHRNNTTVTEMPTPELTIYVETDNCKYGCKQNGGCRANLAMGRCHDAFVRQHIARLFWPDKYMQKTK